MIGAWGHRLRAIWVMALLIVLVVGVPYLLLTVVGNPFPASVPSVNELRILLTQNGQGFANFIIGTLAVLIWAMWLQLMIALVVEVSATVRRSESRRLPIAPGVQSFAARLVAAVTLATTLAAAPLLTSAAGALDLGLRPETAPSISVQMEVVDLRESQQKAHLDDDMAAPAPDSTQGHPILASLTLNDSTELWDLAESAYGDGVMWKAIAAANSGRVDADGHRITETTEVVAQGTQLMLPGDVDSDGASVFGVSADVAVSPGDSMWSIAQAEVEGRLGRSASDAEVAAYWSAVVEANAHVSSGDVDLIYPGEMLTLPGSAPSDDRAAADAVEDLFMKVPPLGVAPAAVVQQDVTIDVAQAEVEVAPAEGAPGEETSTPEPLETEVPVAPAIAVPEPERPREAPTSGTSESESIDAGAVGLAALGTALLCMGAVAAIRRRRDLQRRTRPEGSTARRPSTEAAAFEAAMRHASDELRESELDGGWRAMPASAVDAMRQRGPLQIHAEANGALHAVSVADRVDLSDETQPPLAFGAAIVPTSLVVGTEQPSGDAVLLDLASALQVRVEGSPAEVRRFARSAIVDLAVSERADDLRVIAVGVGRELVDLERVLLVDDFAEALDAAVASGHVGDTTTPLVVVSTIDPGPAVADLVDRGVIVVAPGIDSETQVLLDGDAAELRPTGTQVQLASLSDDHYRSVAELVEVTSAAAVVPVGGDELIVNNGDVSPATECPIAVGPVDVRVLGPVEVAGAAPFSSLKAVDVIAYLAFHRNGVDADQIKSWVWPTFEPPTDKALANVMSRARTGLGADDAGEPYLSRAGVDKTYRLSPQVTTDFDRFRALVGLADDDDDPENQLNMMRRALELIRGVPFTGGAASSFAWADNHVRAQVEFTIDETVHRCADLALELGDVATARWSALKGLELVPGCEQCFRRRFLVASADNNRSELRRAMADLERSAAIELGEPEAVDTISGDLLDLYHQLDRALVGDAL